VTQLQYVYASGLDGAVTYSYGAPATDASDWWGYVAENVYTTTATVPTMPWRSPATATNGMMWGRVKDAKTGLYVDDATVTVASGPTVKTDGNGYFVATLISATAAGAVHSTTASKAGMTSHTIADATVIAGDIVRYDFLLNLPKLSVSMTGTNTVMISWPSPCPGWSLWQLTNLCATNWTTPSESISDNGTNKWIIVPPPTAGRLFRLRGA
jgi:hypothetical protein